VQSNIICIDIKLKKNTTLSEQFQNSIDKSLKEEKSIKLTHKYMITDNSLKYEQFSNTKLEGLTSFMGPAISSYRLL